MSHEREYGVDGERERAVEAGVIDVLEAGEGDDRFRDLIDVLARRYRPLLGPILAHDTSGSMQDERYHDAVTSLRFEPFVGGGTVYDAAAMHHILEDAVRVSPSAVVIIVDDTDRAIFNRAIDAEIESLIAVEVGPIPENRKAFLWGRPEPLRLEPSDRFRFAERDPFIDAVIGKEEPNDRRKGFYREFEGKRRDGSFKRAKRHRR